MWLEQGVTFQMLGRFENASESYLRATECSNSDYTAWVRYAHVHKFRSDIQQDMKTKLASYGKNQAAAVEVMTAAGWK